MQGSRPARSWRCQREGTFRRHRRSRAGAAEAGKRAGRRASRRGHAAQSLPCHVSPRRFATAAIRSEWRGLSGRSAYSHGRGTRQRRDIRWTARKHLVHASFREMRGHVTGSMSRNAGRSGRNGDRHHPPVTLPANFGETSDHKGRKLQGRQCFCWILVAAGYGGEGEIRTPDSLSTMPDFESGAFNRALPPLRSLLAILCQDAARSIAS
jgi:hypothetical protein